MGKRISAVIFVLLVFFFSSGRVWAKEAGLKNVEALMLKGDYSQAASECKKLLAQDRRSEANPKAYYLLGLCLLKEAEFVQARDNFRKILQHYSGSKFHDDAAIGIADSYFLAEDYAQASKEYEEFLQHFSASPLADIARIHLEQCRQGNSYASSYFSVQIGCFGKSKNAEQLRGKLIDSGFQAYILKYPEDSFYKVRVGRFDNRLEAELLEQRLKSAGFTTKICP